MFLAALARHGYSIPEEVLSRDVTKPWAFQEALVPVFKEIYESEDTLWSLYQACEDLVDVEDNFQAWRFRHLRVVQRTIGFKRGTGGSSGVDFLKRALDLTFFPELFAVRTEIGKVRTSLTALSLDDFEARSGSDIDYPDDHRPVYQARENTSGANPHRGAGTGRRDFGSCGADRHLPADRPRSAGSRAAIHLGRAERGAADVRARHPEKLHATADVGR